MNYDKGWSSDAGEVFAHQHTLAVRVPEGRQRIMITYSPRFLGAGLLAAPRKRGE
ncbi:hypothetical protein D3C83_215940 [compost metagenome]